MELNETTNKTGIIQAIERYINRGDAYISGTAARLAEFKARINHSNRKAWHIIFSSSGNWHYDDANQTDDPDATVNLVDGTAEYDLPAGTLTVKRVEVKDESDNWTVLKPMALHDLKQAVDEVLDSDSTPIKYRLFQDKIELFPAPNYTQASSLKVYFDRTSVDLSANDDEPGFASPYHEYLAIDSAIEWYKVKNPEAGTLQVLLTDRAQMEMAMSQFYRNRFKSYKPRLTRKGETWK